MNLATMRGLFRKHVSEMSGALSDAEIDLYLNRAYEFTLPLDITGEFSEGVYKFYATVGQRDYTVPPYVVGLKTQHQAWISGTYDGATETLEMIQWVWIETDPTVFESRRAGQHGLSGRPNRALIYGKEIKFDRMPDQRYILNFPGRLGPTAKLDQDGIAHDIHAMAVISAAAAEYLTEVEDAEGIARETSNYTRYRSQLHTYSQTRANRRGWRRSF